MLIMSSECEMAKAFFIFLSISNLCLILTWTQCHVILQNVKLIFEPLRSSLIIVSLTQLKLPKCHKNLKQFPEKPELRLPTSPQSSYRQPKISLDLIFLSKLGIELSFVFLLTENPIFFGLTFLLHQIWDLFIKVDNSFLI